MGVVRQNGSGEPERARFALEGSQTCQPKQGYNPVDVSRSPVRVPPRSPPPPPTITTTTLGRGRAIMSLPADVQAALDKYNSDIRADRIMFGDNKFAEQYPGRGAAHHSLMEHIRAHVHELPPTPPYTRPTWPPTYTPNR